MGAASVGPRGIMQADIVLVAAERRLIDRAEQLILLVDSSKFRPPCFSAFGDLAEIDEVITDAGLAPEHLEALRATDVTVTVVPTDAATVGLSA
jgi:DeoR family ulaG and ulaABCDEF operon transcriptional repressor